MFSVISRKSIDCCKLIITKYSHSAVTESINPVIFKSQPSESSISKSVISPDKLQYPEGSKIDVVKKDDFHYKQPDASSSQPGIFAYYIKKSPLLQELFRLGVNLHEIEKNAEAAQFLLRCNFEDIREHIVFLKELSLEIPQIGYILSKNPLLLKEDIDDLKVRVNYLQYKRFDDKMITTIVQKNPFWLTHSTQQIDDLLGYFQNTFKLTGNEVRMIVMKNPRLITFPLAQLKLNTFALKEEIGFTTEELKTMILYIPTVLKHHKRLLQVAEYTHQVMHLPLERIVQEPEILLCRKERLANRHSFLEKLGKVQYDPKKPNYISLKSLVSGTDAEFCNNIARSSVELYNTFLKTL